MTEPRSHLLHWSILLCL